MVRINSLPQKLTPYIISHKVRKYYELRKENNN